MTNEPKNLAECEEIPSELMHDIKKRNAARRAAAKTIVAEPVKDACMDYARRGWRMAYIMTAVAGCLAGVCVWLVRAAL